MPKNPAEIVEQNLERVRARIREACRRCGRDPAGVTLVAVTKLVGPAVAGILLDLGVEQIGESRVVEAERKRSILGERGTWHLVGHLQRNKVKKALRLFSMIHSVDSVRLLRELSGQCQRAGLVLPVLLEVNVSGEASKHGFRPEAALEAARTAAELDGLALKGLMTMAPYSEDPEEARPHFRALKEIFDALRPHAGVRFDVLSMGMTGDFETAIEEGATHVRIGTALFEGLS